MKGKITEWDDRKGYGFISMPNGYSRAFLHISAVDEQSRRPRIGDAVKFDSHEENENRHIAFNVTILIRKPVTPTIIFCSVYLILAMTAAFALAANNGMFFIIGNIMVSFITYKAYALDKAAAKNNQWRTPEKTLHCLALLGGWPGALFAQSWLRHKSKKQPFKFILWLMALLNITAFLYISTT